MTSGLPPLADEPPVCDHVTDYDRRHLKTYARLLDAAADEADWREVARVVLGLDASQAPDHVRQVHAAHLERARWLGASGYRDLVDSRSSH